MTQMSTFKISTADDKTKVLLCSLTWSSWPVSAATHKDRLTFLNSSSLEKLGACIYPNRYQILYLYMVNRNVNLSDNLTIYHSSFLISLLGLSEPPTGILGAWSWPWGWFFVVFLNLNVIYPHQPMIYFGNHGICLRACEEVYKKWSGTIVLRKNTTLTTNLYWLL